MKISLWFITLILSVLTQVMAYATGSEALPKVVVAVGPEGEVITLEKAGEYVLIRQCEKYTPVSKIASARCALEPGTNEIKLNSYDFGSLVRKNLLLLSKSGSGLSPKQTQLLQLAFVDFLGILEEEKEKFSYSWQKYEDNLDRIQREIQFTEEHLASLKGDLNQGELDAADLTKLNDEIKLLESKIHQRKTELYRSYKERPIDCVESQIIPQKDAIMQAKKEVDIIAAKLLETEDGQSQKVIRYDQNAQKIAFATLKKIVTGIRRCDSIDPIEEGDVCTTSKGAVFTKVKEGWQDSDGLIWMPTKRSLKREFYGSAVDLCTVLHGSLPTKVTLSRLSLSDDEANAMFLLPKDSAGFFPDGYIDPTAPAKHVICVKKSPRYKGSWWSW